ncbi:MAG: VWA domain-containing protein [Planctomycetota bacterium]
MRFAGSGLECAFGVALTAVVLAVAAWRRRRDAIARKNLLPRTTSPRGGYIAIVGTASLAVLAIGRPEGGFLTQASQSREGSLWFCFDVSRSMLVQDRPDNDRGSGKEPPSRLELAKQAASELLTDVENHPVGVIAFSGDAAVLCPPTEDHAFVREKIHELSIDSAPAGGTSFDKLFRFLGEHAAKNTPVSKQVVLLFSDGGHGGSSETPQLKNVCVLCAIGCGKAEPGTVPSAPGGPPLRERGELITSRLQADVLRSLANGTGGSYHSVQEVFTKPKQTAAKRAPAFVLNALEQSSLATVPADRFQWFLLPALVLALGATRLRRLA